MLRWSDARISEVLALTPAAIDIESGVVSIDTLKRRKRGIVRQVPIVLRELDRVFEVRIAQRDPQLATLRLWRWSRTTAWRSSRPSWRQQASPARPACGTGLASTPFSRTCRRIGATVARPCLTADDIHIRRCCRRGGIRRWTATDAAAYEGRRLGEGLDKANTASGIWANTAYRSVADEAFLAKNGFVSHIHRKKPKGRTMPEVTRRAQQRESRIRSRVEHVFAEQKERMVLFIRTIGIARATIKIGLANLVYNIKRLIFLRRAAVV